MTYQEETEMLNYLMETRTSEDYEETGSIIKLYLNIVENNNCKYRPTFAEDILDIAYQSITDFIETTTTDEIDAFNDELLREIGEKLNILSRYWKEKRNRKRKQLINKLKIHSVEHLVLSYL